MPFQIIDNGSPAVASAVLFDATALDPNQVWQVTAYAWPCLVAGNPASLGFFSFRISLVTVGVSTVDLLRLDSLQAAAFFNAAAADGKAPKVLDKVTLRGNQQIVLSVVTGEGPTGSALAAYGYFEMNASDALPYDFRPLEPATLVAPFNAAPTVLSIAAAGAVPVYATAHLLSPTYADFVTITVNVAGVAGPFDNSSLAVLSFPNGVQLALNRAVPTTGASTLNTLLEDIPLLAPSATNNALQIGFVSADVTGSVQATAWGHFTRVS